MYDLLSYLVLQHALACHGVTENAIMNNVISTRDWICRYGKPKHEVTRVKNASMENTYK